MVTMLSADYGAQLSQTSNTAHLRFSSFVRHSHR